MLKQLANFCLLWCIVEKTSYTFVFDVANNYKESDMCLTQFQPHTNFQVFDLGHWSSISARKSATADLGLKLKTDLGKQQYVHCQNLLEITFFKQKHGIFIMRLVMECILSCKTIPKVDLQRSCNILMNVLI